MTDIATEPTIEEIEAIDKADYQKVRETAEALHKSTATAKALYGVADLKEAKRKREMMRSKLKEARKYLSAQRSELQQFSGELETLYDRLGIDFWSLHDWQKDLEKPH